jgi:uncharacterized membrane protein YraQ (UPF0718 family)
LRFALFTVRFEIGNVVVSAMSSLMLAMCIVSIIPYFKPLPLTQKNG